MRYVTESELRDEYAACPFDTYRLAPDTRLTPGARQFLVDFRITFDAGMAPPRAETGAPAPDDQRLCDSFLDDVRVLGAKLCLLARRSSGISRGLSCRLLRRGSGLEAGGPRRGRLGCGGRRAGMRADADVRPASDLLRGGVARRRARPDHAFLDERQGRFGRGDSRSHGNLGLRGPTRPIRDRPGDRQGPGGGRPWLI